MGTHNMALKAFDFEATPERLTGQGLKIAQIGKIGDGSRFTYVDIVKQYGHYLEVLYFDMEYEKIFNQIKMEDF